MLKLFKLNRTIVHLENMIFQQANDLRSGQQYRAVTMCRKNTGRTIVIKRGIESHTGSYTGSFDLPPRIYLAGNSIPGQQTHWPISPGIYPSAIDRPGNTIGINGAGGGLQVGVVLVQ